MDVDTKCSVIALQNSNCQENLRNSLESVAGEAQKRVRDQRSLKQALDSKLHSNANEHSLGKCTFSTANIENILKTRG